MDLVDLRWRLCGWTRELAAERLGVTVRTVWNWETGRHAAPRYLEDYYRMASGTAPAWAPLWVGWYIGPEGLFDPGGWLHRPNEIMHARWIVTQVAKMKKATSKGPVASMKDAPPTAGTAGRITA